MYEELILQDKKLRNEVDILLYERGILSILNKYGQTQVHGSYYLKLMVRRDLDIYIMSNKTTLNNVMELSKELTSVLFPTNISYNKKRFNNLNQSGAEFWDIRVRQLVEPYWKIDIWILNKNLFVDRFSICERTRNLLTPETHKIILTIKNELIHYLINRHKITSMDIYNAVLFNNVKDINSFWKYINLRENHLSVLKTSG